MKKHIHKILLSGFMLLGTYSFAQDPVKVASNVYKGIILENDNVRVMNVEFAPGESAAMHSHPNHVVYALTSGKIEITDKDKKVIVADLKEGQALFMDAVTHSAKNIGNTTLKVVVTEIKPMNQGSKEKGTK